MHLQTVHESYRDKGVAVLGFNSTDDGTIARDLLAKHGASYPTILDTSREARRLQRTAYRCDGVPVNYLIDRDGRVAAAWPGYRPGDGRGIEAIEELLAR